MPRLGRKKIIAILEKCLGQSSCQFSIEGTDNPILLQIEDRVFTVFLKPIGDVCYENENESTRVQLPKHPRFDKIKASKRPFLLMGFDLDNEIFTIWNPTATKERLNTRKNLSFYCRLNAQREANNTKLPVRCNLTNGDFLWVLPMGLLAEFLMYIEDYFPLVTVDEYGITGDYSAHAEYEELFRKEVDDVLDEDGRIVAIKNPVVLEELKEACSSGKAFAEYEVLYKYYADKTSIMNLADWARLLNSINWNEEI